LYVIDKRVAQSARAQAPSTFEEARFGAEWFLLPRGRNSDSVLALHDDSVFVTAGRTERGGNLFIDPLSSLLSFSRGDFAKSHFHMFGTRRDARGGSLERDVPRLTATPIRFTRPAATGACPTLEIQSREKVQRSLRDPAALKIEPTRRNVC